MRESNRDRKVASMSSCVDVYCWILLPFEPEMMSDGKINVVTEVGGMELYTSLHCLQTSNTTNGCFSFLTPSGLLCQMWSPRRKLGTKLSSIPISNIRESISSGMCWIVGILV